MGSPTSKLSTNFSSSLGLREILRNCGLAIETGSGRYLLIIRNEENCAEKKTLTMNRARVILLLTFGFLIALGIAIYLVTSILDEWLAPRPAQMMANRQIIELSMSIDSLEREVKNKDLFIENIKLILGGGDDSQSNIIESESRRLFEDIQIPKALNPIDSQFRVEL